MHVCVRACMRTCASVCDGHKCDLTIDTAQWLTMASQTFPNHSVDSFQCDLFIPYFDTFGCISAVMHSRT